jgi:hypothetical protein
VRRQDGEQKRKAASPIGTRKKVVAMGLMLMMMMKGSVNDATRTVQLREGTGREDKAGGVGKYQGSYDRLQGGPDEIGLVFFSRSNDGLGSLG